MSRRSMSLDKWKKEKCCGTCRHYSRETAYCEFPMNQLPAAISFVEDDTMLPGFGKNCARYSRKGA